MRSKSQFVVRLAPLPPRSLELMHQVSAKLVSRF